MCSIPEQLFNITAGADHMKNQHVLTFNTVDNKVFACNKTPQTGTQVFVAAASDVGIS
ncbi:MAG TPA: hypothetical protein VJO16_20240 [Candidatus Acidoferrum sp.]|nr:hypothetical protein [Candidatus Acidoferrum sp.]